MRRVLAHRDFRLLWLSQAGSTIGDRMVIVALAIYVNDIGTPTDVGIVLAAGTVPFVALLLIGGVWADRLPRHRVMVVTDLVRGALHALLAVLILSHSAEVWQIAVIEAVFGAAHAFFRPAYTGLVPQTVPEDLLQEATAVTFMTFNVAGFAGPALASTLVVTAGAGFTFVIDAATFFASAALLGMVHPRERGEPAAREPMLAELAGGWREVRSRAWVWSVVGMASLSLLVSLGPYQALGPAVAGAIYGHTAIYGVVSAVRGVGAIAGSIIAVRWRPRRMLFAGLVCGLPWGLINITYAAGIPLAALIAFSLVAGAGSSLFITYWETSLAVHVPPRALSRVSSFDWMGSLALLPVGLVLAGPVAEAIGARETMIAGGSIAMVTGLVVTFSRPVRQLQSNAPLVADD